MREEEEKLKIYSSRFATCLGESSQNGATMSKVSLELLKNEIERVKNKFLFKYVFSNSKKSNMSVFEAGHALNSVVMDKAFGKEQTLSKRPVRVLDLIVNESRSNAAGMTLHKPSEHNNRLTIESLLSSIVVTYGGYSVEEKLFGCHTDGVKGDLDNNTEKIFNAITDYGLGSKTRHLCVKPGGGVYELYKNDVKNDLEKYSNTGMSIANKISEFAAPFITEYTEIHLKNPVKVIKGEDFIKMFEDWLVKSKKKKEFNNLCEEIKIDVQKLRTEMTSV